MTDFTTLSSFNLAMVEDYERCLRLNKNMPKTYFNGCSAVVKNERAIILFKYFFEKLVQWTPLEIINYLSKDVIDKAKLAKAYSAIDYPPEFSKRDYFYMAKLCYPDEVGSLFNYRDLIILRYKKVLESGKSFPKKYFDAPDGNDKARIIMQHALFTSEKRFKNVDELYSYFADKKTSNEFLAKNKLKNICTISFPTPLDYAHYSLAPEQREDAYYNMYKINNFLAQNGIKL